MLHPVSERAFLSTFLLTQGRLFVVWCLFRADAVAHQHVFVFVITDCCGHNAHFVPPSIISLLGL